jgi:NadR type nicotinamide-nucleotide adenylyltransferase
MRISITGPESSGKSILSKQLAEYFGAGWVPEFARKYLENQGGDAKISDLISICEGQLESERRLESKHADIICDTDFLVLKIWAQVVYDQVPFEIQQAFQTQTYDLILLCKPDLEWEPDPLRSMPKEEDRMRLFELYKAELIANNRNFQIIEGQGDERFQLALKYISPFKKG